jgi:hypothetical protein
MNAEELPRIPTPLPVLSRRRSFRFRGAAVIDERPEHFQNGCQIAQDRSSGPGPLEGEGGIPWTCGNML